MPTDAAHTLAAAIAFLAFVALLIVLAMPAKDDDV